MHVIAHQVALYNFTSLVRCQLSKYRHKFTPDMAIQQLPSTLRYVHHEVLTIPPGMTQALILFHCESSSLGGDFRFTWRRDSSNLG